MEESSRAVATGERIPRLIRRALLTVVLLMIIAIVWLFIEQTSNKVTVTNDSGVPYTLRFTLRPERDLSTPQPIERVLLADQIIFSQTKFYWTFRKSEGGLFRLVAVTDRGEYRFLSDNVSPWGNRVLATFGDNGLQNIVCEISPFRKWFEANRSRIPLPGNWLE